MKLVSELKLTSVPKVQSPANVTVSVVGVGAASAAASVSSWVFWLEPPRAPTRVVTRKITTTRAAAPPTKKGRLLRFSSIHGERRCWFLGEA